MNKLFFILFILPSITAAQNNYIGKVFNQNKESLSYIKIYHADKLFNTDSIGVISGNLKIGDTLVFSKREFKNNIHIVKNLNENIFLEEIFTEIPEINISHKNIIREYNLKKDKKRVYYSLNNGFHDAFLYKNDKTIVFNTIEFPIKYVSYAKGLVTNEKTHFTLQFFNVDKGLPNEPLSDKIDFEIKYINNSKKTFSFSLSEKIVIPNQNFFIIIEVNEKSNTILDKKGYSFNPTFLCNEYGEEGSYLQYSIKTGKWEIFDLKKRGFIPNLLIHLKMNEETK